MRECFENKVGQIFNLPARIRQVENLPYVAPNLRYVALADLSELARVAHIWNEPSLLAVAVFANLGVRLGWLVGIKFRLGILIAFTWNEAQRLKFA